MKSLIIKDVYNILHNMKSLFLMLFVFLFLILPKGGAAAYAITCCILCAMMIVTTFSFDENAKWEKICHGHAGFQKRPCLEQVCRSSFFLHLRHGIRRDPGNRRQHDHGKIPYLLPDRMAGAFMRLPCRNGYLLLFRQYGHSSAFSIRSRKSTRSYAGRLFASCTPVFRSVFFAEKSGCDTDRYRYSYPHLCFPPCADPMDRSYVPDKPTHFQKH